MYNSYASVYHSMTQREHNKDCRTNNTSHNIGPLHTEREYCPCTPIHSSHQTSRDREARQK